MDCSPPGASVHGLFQARILGQVAISSSSLVKEKTLKTHLPKSWTCSRLLNLLESEYRRGAHITQVGQWFQPWGELGKAGFSGFSRKRTEKATERALIPASASSLISLPQIPSSDLGYRLPDLGGAGTAPRRRDRGGRRVRVMGSHAHVQKRVPGEPQRAESEPPGRTRIAARPRPEGPRGWRGAGPGGCKHTKAGCPRGAQGSWASWASVHTLTTGHWEASLREWLVTAVLQERRLSFEDHPPPGPSGIFLKRGRSLV